MILVMDDLRMELEQIVTSLGIMMDAHPEYRQEIITAETREEALDLFHMHKDQINAAVLDVILHRATDGILVAKAIQENKEIPIVLVTGSYAISDVPSIRSWALDGNGNHTAVDVCHKIGDEIETFAQFADGLYDSMTNAMGKIGKGNDTKFYDKLIRRAQSFDSPPLLDSLRVIFKQFRAEILHMINSLGDDRKYFPASIDLEDAEDVMAFCHIAKRPLYMLSQADRLIDNPSNTVPEIAQRSKMLFDVLMYVSMYRLKYDPVIDERKAMRAELKGRERKDFPVSESQKLIRRTAMLERDKTPYLVISPEDDVANHKKKLEEILAVTGTVILRSAGVEDIIGMPMRGFFDSYPGLRGFDSIQKAVAELRSMSNPALAQFLTFNGYKLPPAPHGIIEPYHTDKINGSMLEHPDFPGIFLIEYTLIDSFDRINSGFLYDSINDRVIQSEKGLVEHEALARELLRLYKRNKELFPIEAASQMEFCFSDPGHIHDLQFVDFKPYKKGNDFEFLGNLIFGRCKEENLAVVYPYSIEQMAIVSRLAKQEGYKLGVVVDHREIDTKSPGTDAKGRFHLASLPDNIGLAITTEGLLLQGHDYHNLLSAAENVLCLNDGTELDELGLRPGQILTYSSDGIRYSMEKHDDTDEIMREVRRIINSSS